MNKPIVILFALRKLFNAKKLIGDPKLFTLEERIFNTVLVIAMIAMAFEIPFNFTIGLVVPGILCVCGLLLSVSLYYLSRYKRKKAVSIVIFCIACNIIFTINYFFNSGVFGPNLLLFTLVFLLTVAVISKEQFKIWLPINLFIVIGILIIEYCNPQLIKNTYINELSKFIDFGITYLVTITLTYFTISYIRKNYDDERSSALDKSSAIEAQKILLEKLNSEKNKLFSLVTHDIKTPLNSIQSYLELLVETDLDEEERQSLKKQLLKITKDTSSMLTNVLSWYRTQIDGITANLQKLNISETLRHCFEVEQTTSKNKGVDFAIACQEDIQIMADHNMFQLVIRNLVNNAIKFTPQGGLVQVNAEKKNGECVIMVRDSGIGISKEQQAILFQLNASSTIGTNNERGIGLGLLLCKEFTDLQEGKIWLESTSNKGSTFYLSFKLINE